MALLFVDGFDFWTTKPGCWNAFVENGISVTGSVLTTPFIGIGANMYIRKTFVDSSTIIVNFRFKSDPHTLSQFEQVMAFRYGDTLQCTLNLNSAGQFAITNGDHDGTQVGGFSSLAITRDVFYDLEIKITPANSGSAELRVNGESVLSVSGDLSSTGDGVNNIQLGKNGINPSNICPKHYEHVIIMDTVGTSMNDFIGPVKVNPHALTADGFHTDFTANVGDRWDAVNDADPDGDTTYISANVVGNKYTAVADNLPAGITDVYALAVWTYSKRDDDVTRAYRALVRYSSTDQLSSVDKYIGPAYGYQMSTFEVSPFTAVAWTPTEVDGLEVGVQLTI